MLAGVTLGSVVLGAVLSRVTIWWTRQIQDVATAVIIQFVSTFAVWMLAERLHLSGIITMVVFAILVARQAPQLIPARLRIPSYAVWEVVVFVLNVLAFILVGLQLKPILERLDRPQLFFYLATAAAVCAAVIVVRIVWVLGYGLFSNLLRSRVRIPSFRAAAVISWCGMRGIVTLAAALALPADFPRRDLILFTAFCVVLVTLVLQGMTVSPLLRALRLEDDGEVDREVRLARAETAKAGLDALAGVAPDSDLLRLLRRKYEARHRRAAAAAPENEPPPDDGLPEYAAAYERAQRAERLRLAELRDDGTIGDDAFHKVEEELDWAEANMEAAARSQ
jgi:CPA1 family monovalent cation:H+ antiporter